MNDKIKAQIMAVRKTAVSNMFDLKTVQRIAFEMGFYELVTYIEENPTEYVNFILYGKTE